MDFKLPFNKETLGCSKVIGLHCSLNSGSEPEFTSVIIFRKKGILEIETLSCFKCDFGKLNENLPSGLPIVLSIDGKGILHKKVNSDNNHEVLKNAMPGSNKEDFMIDFIHGHGNENCFSIARREYLDEIVGKLNTSGLYIIDIYINPLRVAQLKILFNEFPSFFISGVYEIHSDDGKINGYNKHDPKESSELKYSFDGYELESRYLLPFYNAIKFFSGEKNENLPEGIKHQRSEFHAKRRLAFGGISSLVIIFIILVLNYNLFTNLSGKKEQLDQILINNKELIANIAQLKEEVIWKEKFISQSGINQNRSLSYICDNIGASIPKSISLDKLELHPFESKISPNKEILFQTNILRISGTAATSSALNEWIIRLKELKWANTVIVKNFLQTDNSNAPAFTVEITILESKH